MANKNPSIPNKYSKEKVDRICESLLKMSSKTQAAQSAGISRSVFYDWYNTNPEFKQKIDETMAEVWEKGKQVAIQSVFRGMETQWTAGAWWLERNFPAEFGKRERVDMDVNEKKVVFHIGVVDNDTKKLMGDAVKLIDKDGKEIEEK